MINNVKKNKQIEEIIDNFDFFKIEKVMSYLNWTWYNFNYGKTYFPSITQLKDCARKLLDEALTLGVETKKDGFISTAGFKAEYLYKIKLLRLTFYIEDFELELERIDL